MQSLADSEGPSSDLSGKPPPADKSIRRAESLRRDSPLQPIVLARQALQVCCACVHVCTCVCLQTFTARVVQGAGQAGLQGSVRATSKPQALDLLWVSHCASWQALHLLSDVDLWASLECCLARASTVPSLQARKVYCVLVCYETMRCVVAVRS